MNAGYLYEDDELQAYLVKVMRRLYPEYGDAIQVRIVDSPSLNAFALPGGPVSTGAEQRGTAKKPHLTRRQLEVLRQPRRGRRGSDPSCRRSRRR